ncbi:MAG: N-acetylneuraminate synthase family protein [Deltaproteobacteria bacterium]|jgi:sialic acid synthase SpsE|nr:N-acetylneuraminate synthase family protein [Deltaproteobacteria bacterium]
MPHPPKIVLEIGGNPMGEFPLACEMLYAASKTGAEAVKFQAYKVKDFIHKENPAYNELSHEEMDFSKIRDLIYLSHQMSLKCGITVFDKEGIELAIRSNADFIKLSSGDINYLDLLYTASSSPLPFVISTGASFQSEVDRALSLSRKKPMAVLQCTSIYPTAPSEINLSVMDEWLNIGIPAGLSDHSEGIQASIIALQRGAVMVEKHFTIDRNLPGGDNSMSILPSEVKELVEWENAKIANPVESPYWGEAEKKPLPGERPDLIRRHLVSKNPLKKGIAPQIDDLSFFRVMAEDNSALIPADIELARLIPKEDIQSEVVLHRNLFHCL